MRKSGLRQLPSSHQSGLCCQEVQRMDPTCARRAQSWAWTIDDGQGGLAGTPAAWWAKRRLLPRNVHDTS